MSTSPGASRTASPPRSSPPPRAAPRVRFGILARTTVTMLVLGVVPILLFGGVSLFLQARRLRAETRHSLQASGERITAQVDEWLDKNVRLLRAVAQLPAMTSMRPEEQTPVLVAVNRAYPWIYLAHTIAPGGKNVGRSDGKPPADYVDRQYYKDVMAGKDLAWQTAIGKTSGKPALMLAVPISSNGAVVGVLTAAMTVEDVSSLFANWRTGRTGYAFLVDDEARVVAHPREEFVTGQARLAEHPLIASFRADRLPHGLAFTQTDGKNALGYVRGNRLGWAVAIQQDEEELLAPLRETLALGLVLLAGGALVVAVVGRAASSVLVRPILALTAAADRMSTGDLDTPIPIARADELGVLGRSLDRLRISMRAAMARLG